jgi:hypothetical protein
MTISEFLEIFPEFENYPPTRVNFFLDAAQNAISEERFGKQTEYARGLYAAHLCTVLKNGQTAESGTASPADVATGAIASKSVGSASVSFDVSSVSETDAGYFNASSYGRLLWGLLRQYRRMPFVTVGRAQCP